MGMEKVSMVPGLFRAFYEKYQQQFSTRTWW